MWQQNFLCWIGLHRYRMRHTGEVPSLHYDGLQSDTKICTRCGHTKW